MKKGQGSIEYLVMVTVALILLALVFHYVYTSSKGVPITGITYIDPELSPEKPGYDHPVTWVVYKYPLGCEATKNCDFYVSVNLHYYPDTGKYRFWVYANGDSADTKKIRVRLCNGATGEWNFPEDKGKNKINGVYLHEDDFPCALSIMAWRR
ncbi:hypothetical protein A3L08_06325 [Thermococcus pacificus]|uniref:Class III signal peptide-containing protein n=2 Tax=Thermococcus pacificus TaxID=71998 RepID=A0A218P846_9EURY|nr:hypothetical protein A3L08_06325 [Thermococcus pacificus]